MMAWREQLETEGFVLLPGVFAAEEVRIAIAEWNEIQHQHAANEAILASENGPAYGARNLLQLWPRVMELARHPALCNPLREVLGCSAGVVRVLFFDKPPGHSWALPWHKDYNIAVVEHGVEGTFTKPTTKAGVPHVMAPYSLLNTMLTARIHLDDVTAQNGPLRVIPGSHRFYHTGEDETRDVVAIHCRAGDVLLMRPLLTHASGNSQPDVGSHRRIVHLECATSHLLPDGYQWHQFESLGEVE
ncbi:MAG TPA: phytanoyl-CoA dioxygenase family protein [Gemmata sp.]|jgi:ectoine hydroxylase-related dioxygenase (phytanoyl-CoA dioxygenase family)|nr:phytanoyl-CoA dioxygenase family protein [Gemmata sp.]